MQFRKKTSLPLIFLAAAFSLPLLVLLGLSFATAWRYPAVIPSEFSFANWLFLSESNSHLTPSFLNSLSIALLVATIACLFGFITSKVIAYHRFRQQLQFLAYFPFALSPVIFAVCIKFYFIKLNLTGNYLGLILAQLIIAFPYSVLFFLGFWNKQLAQYEQLVSTLGGTADYAFKKVILPIAKPFLLVGFFQCFLISWFEFGLTSILGYGKVPTLTLKVFQYIGESNIFFAALSCCLLIIPPVILLWINKKFILSSSK